MSLSRAQKFGIFLVLSQPVCLPFAMGQGAPGPRLCGVSYDLEPRTLGLKITNIPNGPNRHVATIPYLTATRSEAVYTDGVVVCEVKLRKTMMIGKIIMTEPVEGFIDTSKITDGKTTYGIYDDNNDPLQQDASCKETIATKINPCFKEATLKAEALSEICGAVWQKCINAHAAAAAIKFHEIYKASNPWYSPFI